jgi:hypothetical protein
VAIERARARQFVSWAVGTMSFLGVLGSLTASTSVLEDN